MKSMVEFAKEINAVVEGRKVPKVPNKKMAPLTKVEKELQNLMPLPQLNTTGMENVKELFNRK